jgi:hypothetical protein
MDGSRRADATGWELLTGPEFRVWQKGLTGPAAESVSLALESLIASGPKPRPTLVKPIKSSRHRDEMHELRSVGGNRRVLFAKTGKREERRGVLLLGGDKTDQWDRWYDINVRLADGLFDRFQHTKGDSSQWRALNLGSRSATLDR